MITATPQSAVAEYVLVQYMRDTRRKEPRNIGVAVWSPSGGISWRFLEDGVASEIVSDVKAYDRWTNFWRKKTSGDALDFHGKKTSISSPEYLDALLKTQKGEYVLRRAGKSLNALATNDLHEFSAQLFADLVEPAERPRSAPQVKVTDERLSEKCQDAFASLGATRSPRFHKNPEVSLHGPSGFGRFRFSYGWGDGRYDVLFQRTALAQQTSVTSTAFLFGLAHKSEGAGLKGVRTISLIDSAIDDLSEKARQRVSNHLHLLRDVSTVVDFADWDSAYDKLDHVLR